MTHMSPTNLKRTSSPMALSEKLLLVFCVYPWVNNYGQVWDICPLPAGTGKWEGKAVSAPAKLQMTPKFPHWIRTKTIDERR